METFVCLRAGYVPPRERLRSADDCPGLLYRFHRAAHDDIAGGRMDRAVPVSAVIHGRLTAAAVARLLQSAHAALITSEGFDNQPMIAVEAIRAGRPVIVSDPTLATEFGTAAIAASDTTAEGLARPLISLATNRERLRTAAAGARRYAAHASGPAHATEIENAYNRMTPAATRLHEARSTG